MTTAMTTTNGNGQSGGAMTVYDRVADPLAFVEQMGKVFAHSGACGCKTESEGKLLALACLCERQSPFDIQRRYHLMDGKLSMRAEVMLAEFRNRGGKHKWIKDGSDGREAILELTDADGNVTTARYSIDDAQRAGLNRDGSGWSKNPSNMLRARCSSNAVRMAAPEIVSGVYTPEENEDIAAERRNEKASTAPSRTASDVQSRRAEILAASGGEPAATTAIGVAPEVQTETVIDVAAETAPFAEPAAEETAAPSDGGADWTALLEVTSLLTQVGMTKEQLEEQLRGQNPSFTTLESLPEEKLQTLAANIKAKIEASVKN